MFFLFNFCWAQFAWVMVGIVVIFRVVSVWIVFVIVGFWVSQLPGESEVNQSDL